MKYLSRFCYMFFGLALRYAIGPVDSELPVNALKWWWTHHISIRTAFELAKDYAEKT